MNANTAQTSFPDDYLPQEPCPNCRSRGAQLFYEVRGVPVHDCLLLKTRAEALALPQRDLRLAFCPSCGFIFNTLFDAGVLDYGGGYEETQGFSSTFNTFAKALAQRVVDRYDLHDKTILEIGCGKGEFLTLLCELGPNRGVGMDPAYVPGRLTSPALERIEFIREFYDEKWLHLQADFVCCRHTLEHIAPTADFMELVCRPLRERPNVPVFFELPDVGRILREGAFWDMFYEHCSYFTPGSLARLFRAAGVNVTQLELEYDNQYILIGGVCDGRAGEQRCELEHDLQQTAAGVRAFAQTCAAAMQKWRSTIAEARAAGGRTVIWGAGSKGVSFLTTLGLIDEIEYAVDINPHKHGMFMPCTGQEIVAPEFLIDYRPTHVILMNPIYRGETSAQLRDLGVDAQVLAL